MDFARTEEQSELAAAVRTLLAKRSDSEAVRAAISSESGYDTALWDTLVEQVGVAALAIPEECDGIGASLIETAVVLEELGYFLTPSPLLPSTLAAVALLLAGGGEAELLGELAAGAPGALAIGETDLVLGAADAAILLAIDGDGVLRRRDAAATELVEGMDQTLRFGRLGNGATTELGAIGDPRLLPAISVALTSALQVGAMQRALDMTVRYCGERVQFGRQIGSFQALKHRMADMLALVESSRSASWGASAAAAAAVGDPGPENADRLARLAAVAGSYCADSLEHVVSEMMQLHGGIAITWEHDAHLVFKRAHALTHLNAPAHRLRAALIP